MFALYRSTGDFEEFYAMRKALRNRAVRAVQYERIDRSEIDSFLINELVSASVDYDDGEIESLEAEVLSLLSELQDDD